ncbi:hypothetical protein [Hymenobacter sp. BRD67]|uniref:hypothetical protein n=1 Tax=Hymenobacter sp. BRD67 TaxID=2675877 RepID=UPI001566724D|nr:hypothetical protein [Hymenobacter sp. BRD67]QKG55019.1 hypothetical protein GKZ67_21585 [Hymenobacter sp. BRD67]
MSFVMRPAPEQASDVPLLQWLEVLRDLRHIPDTSPDQVLARVQREIKGLAPTARRRLTELAARQAPPAPAPCSARCWSGKPIKKALPSCGLPLIP